MSRRTLIWTALLIVLFGSGAAGLINQVVWQRALKVFLGGSESISSMVVVVVFLGGLGAGSWLGGRSALRLKDPLLALAVLELTLGAVNFGVRAVLATDISDSVFAAQRVGTTLGVPLWMIYCVGALIVLALPCALMGATMPFAAEASQRRLGEADSRSLGWLLSANTFGAVAGTLAGSGYLMPQYGRSATLLMAVALNIGAGALAFCLRPHGPAVAAVTGSGGASNQPGRLTTPSRIEWLSLALGFCALAYQMLLFRLVGWRHEPLPFTFAAVLAGFLLYWSIGAALSSGRYGPSVPRATRVCGVLIAACLVMFVFDRASPVTGVGSLLWFVFSRGWYFAPCVLFGYLFGRVAAVAAHSWGHDVGRVYAFNTVGSCVGVAIMTLVGYELPFFIVVAALTLVMFALGGTLDAHRGTTQAGSWRYFVPAVGALAAILLPSFVDLSGVIGGLRLFHSRDGVVLVDGNGNLIWDGLWHSRLSQANDHIGSANWYLATAPVIAHRGPVRDALVIGVGAGVTAATIAKSGARVDAYDVNPGLLQLYRRYPEGTLRVADNPAISIRWQDARSGLALSDKQFDVIQTQPLYLKQAGSGLLNSVQFYSLISKRLKPGGVFCLYSNGTPAQALVVRQTAKEVFPHYRSFSHGYLLLLSKETLDLDEASLRERFQSVGAFWDEVRAFERTKDPVAFLQLFDPPDFPWGRGDLISTDDHPIVEYPSFVEERVRELGYRDLPAPGFVR